MKYLIVSVVAVSILVGFAWMAAEANRDLAYLVDQWE
jgi:hypothetical protein